MKGGQVLGVGLLLATAVLPLQAASIEGVEFAETETAGDTRLVLQGTALLRYLVVFKGYVGAFYLPPGVDSGQALGEVPRRLVLEYFHAITAEQFGKATRIKMAENVPPRQFQQMQPQLEQLLAAYQKVAPGDRYALTYLPGEGTRLALNNETLAVIPGADFSRALFSIWIGPRPIDKSFRDHILGISSE